MSESGIAAGTRRIEAATSLGVLKYLEEKEHIINETAKALKIQSVGNRAQGGGGYRRT
ncbi:MAG: hypothetical protein L6V93_09855 [Clostridiales bacterium]|nr:MAG: hypothetical protein L6V93_09855 [Clostridiales bacterium]